MTKYEIIYEALQDKVNSGELSLEDAEILNDIAYNKYLTEDGHSKKLKARHKAKQNNIQQRFYDNMGYKYDYTDEEGNKHGTVKRGDGHEENIVITKKNERDCNKSKFFNHIIGPVFKSISTDDHKIIMSRSNVRQKGSDLTGAHEYSHSKDHQKYLKILKDEEKDPSSQLNKIKNKIYKSNDERDKAIYNYKNKLYNTILDNIDDFKKISNVTKKKIKIKNKHDSEPDEMRADHYASTTTKGKNNTNREKKSLNEFSRRLQQSYLDTSGISDARSLSKKIKNPKNTRENIKKKLLDVSIHMVDNSINNSKKRCMKYNKTRKDVNDYIINKKNTENRK